MVNKDQIKQIENQISILKKVLKSNEFYQSF
jgi:hypothetical protein